MSRSIDPDAVSRGEQEGRVRNSLARAGTLAHVGEMSLTLAHQIKNRLAGIYAAVQVLGRGLPEDDERRGVFEEIEREIRRLDETARDLLRFARPTPLERSPTDVRSWLEGALAAIRELHEVRRHAVEVSAPEGLVVSIDVELMSQVVHQLVLNAAQAMPAAGTIRIAAEERAGTCEIVVADEGEGIPAGLVEAVFQPFYTTKAQGTGLGLSIARKNVEAHGGSIGVESAVGAGSRFRIRLPSASSPSKLRSSAGERARVEGVADRGRVRRCGEPFPLP